VGKPLPSTLMTPSEAIVRLGQSCADGSPCSGSHRWWQP